MGFDKASLPQKCGVEKKRFEQIVRKSRSRSSIDCRYQNRNRGAFATDHPELRGLDPSEWVIFR